MALLFQCVNINGRTAPSSSPAKGRCPAPRGTEGYILPFQQKFFLSLYQTPTRMNQPFQLFHSNPSAVSYKIELRDLRVSFYSFLNYLTARSFPPMVGGLPRMAGGFPPTVGGLPPMTGGVPRMAGGLPPMTGGFPRMIGGLPPMTGGFPPMTGGLPPMTGGFPPTAGGLPPMTGGFPRMARSKDFRLNFLFHHSKTNNYEKA